MDTLFDHFCYARLYKSIGLLSSVSHQCYRPLKIGQLLAEVPLGLSERLAMESWRVISASADPAVRALVYSFVSWEHLDNLQACELVMGRYTPTTLCPLLEAVVQQFPHCRRTITLLEEGILRRTRADGGWCLVLKDAGTT